VRFEIPEVAHNLGLKRLAQFASSRLISAGCCFQGTTARYSRIEATSGED
jgi:hypothetical protein